MNGMKKSLMNSVSIKDSKRNKRSIGADNAPCILA